MMGRHHQRALWAEKLTMTKKAEGTIMDRGQAIHENTTVIDGLGGSAFAFEDILKGGIHVTNVTLNQYPCEEFDHVLNQIRRYYPKLLTTPFEERHVEGFSHISQFPRITEGLLTRGYSDEDCMEIIGGNFLSLFNRVWGK